MQLDYPEVRRPGYFLTHSHAHVSWRSTPRTHNLPEDTTADAVAQFLSQAKAAPEPQSQDPTLSGPSPYPDPTRVTLTGNPQVLITTIAAQQVALILHPWQSIPTIYPVPTD